MKAVLTCIGVACAVFAISIVAATARETEKVDLSRRWALPKVNVTVRNHSGKLVIAATTDVRGQVVLKGLAPGEYEVDVDGPSLVKSTIGYRHITWNVGEDLDDRRAPASKDKEGHPALVGGGYDNNSGLSQESYSNSRNDYSAARQAKNTVQEKGVGDLHGYRAGAGAQPHAIGTQVISGDAAGASEHEPGVGMARSGSSPPTRRRADNGGIETVVVTAQFVNSDFTPSTKGRSNSLGKMLFEKNYGREAIQRGPRINFTVSAGGGDVGLFIYTHAQQEGSVIE